VTDLRVKIDESNCIVVVTPSGTRHTVTNVAALCDVLLLMQKYQALNDVHGTVVFGKDGP